MVFGRRLGYEATGVHHVLMLLYKLDILPPDGVLSPAKTVCFEVLNLRQKCNILVKGDKYGDNTINICRYQSCLYSDRS